MKYLLVILALVIGFCIGVLIVSKTPTQGYYLDYEKQACVRQ